MGEVVETVGSITQSSAQEATSGFIGSLDSQIAYLDTYAANMQLAAERGVDQGILQQLSNGSEESAEILANLVNATEAQIQEMNEKWGKVSDGKDKFAESMTEYTGVIEDEKAVMVDLAAAIGIDMSDALTSGLLSGIDDYEAAWRRYYAGLSSAGTDRVLFGSAAYDALYGAFHLSKATSGGGEAYASGTNYAERGFALVGENGPELVYFRGGERVLTADETREAMQTVYPSAPQMAYLGGGAPAIAHGGGIQLRAVIAVPLEIDGREFARATAEYNGEEMEWGVM